MLLQAAIGCRVLSFGRHNFDLVGLGLYTPSEAARLLGIPASKIARWLRGHEAGERRYAPLWRPQIDLGDGSLHLGFRDLMELRTAHQFMEHGVSAQQIRKAIVEARSFVDDERPLSTTRFRTDGRTIFLEIADQENDARLYDLFRKQFAFKKVIEQSLKDVEYDDTTPSRWWVNSKKNGIVIDPLRSFGQPIDHDSGVPTVVLAAAANAEGSPEAAAEAWDVSVGSVQRAVKFEAELESGNA
jgi:uncharacterized protein (DUF433 family)